MTRFEATVSVLRDIVRSALTGLIVGVVVLGLGGRIVMRLAALLDPSSAGRATENGNRIGDITLDGTAVLSSSAACLSGSRRRLCGSRSRSGSPAVPLRARHCVMPIAVALTGFQLVRPENHDFRILDTGRADPRPAAGAGRDRRVRVRGRRRLAGPAPAATRSTADTSRRRVPVDDPRRAAVPAPRGPHLPGAGVRRPLRPGRGRHRAPRRRRGDRRGLDHQDRDRTARAATGAAAHGHLRARGGGRHRRVAPRRSGRRRPGVG